jgi:hypothetical protein
MFSVLNTIFLHTLPYPNANELVRVYRTNQTSDTPHSPANFRSPRQTNRSLTPPR